MRLLPDLHERILRRVCCYRILPRDPQRDAVEPTPPAIIQ
jgi:hypothetical protein